MIIVSAFCSIRLVLVSIISYDNEISYYLSPCEYNRNRLKSLITMSRTYDKYALTIETAIALQFGP